MPPPTVLDKWLKKPTPDDTGLTRPPVVMLVSAHKDEIRSIVQGCQSTMWWAGQHKIQPNGKNL